MCGIWANELQTLLRPGSDDDLAKIRCNLNTGSARSVVAACGLAEPGLSLACELEIAATNVVRVSVDSREPNDCGAHVEGAYDTLGDWNA